MSRAAALIGVLVFAAVAIGGISAQYESAVTESQNATSIVNETWTPDEGVNTLDESNRDVVYSNQTTVYQNNSEILRGGGNYSWLKGNGTVRIANASDSAINTSRDATISYNYTEPSGAQAVTRDIALIPYIGGNIAYFVGAGLIIGAIAILARQA